MKCERRRLSPTAPPEIQNQVQTSSYRHCRPGGKPAVGIVTSVLLISAKPVSIGLCSTSSIHSTDLADRRYVGEMKRLQETTTRPQLGQLNSETIRASNARSAHRSAPSRTYGRRLPQLSRPTCRYGRRVGRADGTAAGGPGRRSPPSHRQAVPVGRGWPPG